MAKKSSYFTLMFCANCLEPIIGVCRGECQVCGKPLEPIDYFERLRRDKDLSSFEKKKLWIGMMIAAGGLALNMLYGLVSFIICVAKIKMPRTAIPFLWDPIWEGGAVPLIVTILLAVPLTCVPFILKGKCHAMDIFVDLSMGALVVLLITNIPCLILVFVGIIIATDMDHKLIFDRSSREKAKKRLQQKEILDRTEWQCKHCGYINVKRDSECKSCGKYR